jgi:hypothetical protein
LTPGLDELLHCFADAEYPPRTEELRKRVRLDTSVLHHVFERPKGELRVIGRKTDAAAAGVPIGKVVSYFAPLGPAFVRE